MRTREGYGRELQLMIDPKLHHNMLVRIEELEACAGAASEGAESVSQ